MRQKNRAENMNIMSTIKYPKKKWIEPKNSVTKIPECPEDSLQVFANEYLKLQKIDYFRIEDSFFRWVKMRASVTVQKWFFGMFGGRPDNTCSIPIGPYSLTLNLELKTQDSKGRAVGKLHGKQKNRSRSQGWVIARSPEAIMKVVETFENDAQKLKKLIEKYGSIAEMYKNC